MKLTYMFDCSRNAVLSLPAVKRLARILKQWGYSTLSLYCEDTYEVEGEPYFGAFRGRYTREELKQIDNICKKEGLVFSLSVQTLAHMRAIYRHETYYRGAIDCNDVLFVGEERTYLLIDRMFAALSKALSSKEVNIGMDEPRMLGRGKYLDKNGYAPPQRIFTEHLEKVLALAEKHGLKASMWGDFLLEHGDERLFSLVARYNVRVIYWDYGGFAESESERYAENLRYLKAHVSELAFAGSDSKFYGLAPHNRFAVRAAEPCFKAMEQCGVTDLVLTSWGDTGSEVSPFAALPVIAYYGHRANGGDPCAFQEKFSELHGDLSAFYLLDSANELGGKNVGTTRNTSSKYLLYQDVFLGWMDKSVRDFSRVYKEHLSALEEAEKRTKEFAYLFRSQKTLLRALAKKYDLGVLIRAAYARKDRAGLNRIAKKRIPAAAAAIRRYAQAFRRQWLRENKPFGLEVHEARLGALLYRLETCADRLSAYAAGKIKRIEELEEDVPDSFGNGDDIVMLNWGELISAGVVAEYNSYV